jgi:hypothetical protein
MTDLKSQMNLRALHQSQKSTALSDRSTRSPPAFLVSSLFPEHPSTLLEGVLTRASRRTVAQGIASCHTVHAIHRLARSQACPAYINGSLMHAQRTYARTPYLDHQDQSRKRPEWTGMIRSRLDHVPCQACSLTLPYQPASLAAC